MQDILRNIPEDKQKKRAWIYAAVLSLLVSSFMFLNSPGDVNPEVVLGLDPVMLLFMQAVFSIFLFFGLSWVLIGVFFKLNLTYFFKRIAIKDAALTLGILFSFIVSISVVGEWNMNLDFPDSEFEEWAKKSEETLKIFTEHLTNFQSPLHFILGLIVIGVIPAITEELLFRGLLQNLFFRALSNPHIAIWVTAIIFGSIHMQFYGVVPRILLGALFGYLYYWSKNLSITILAHFLNNGIGVTILYFYQKGTMDISPEQMEQAAPWPMVLVFTVIFIFLIRYFYFHQQEKNEGLASRI